MQSSLTAPRASGRNAAGAPCAVSRRNRRVQPSTWLASRADKGTSTRKDNCALSVRALVVVVVVVVLVIVGGLGCFLVVLGWVWGGFWWFLVVVVVLVVAVVVVVVVVVAVVVVVFLCVDRDARLRRASCKTCT